MAWIELHDTLPDHDKVLDLSVALKMDKDMVVGKLVRLWTWALNNREDGLFKARDTATIAEVMRFKGKPQRLVDALVAARLLDVTADGYAIHDWDERVGMLLAKRETTRAQTRERVRRHRNKKLGNGDETECNALQERYETPDETQCNAATVPKPYLLDDEDDDNDAHCAGAGAYAREDDLDEWGAAYADADYAVKAAYRSSFGREATPEEVATLSRIAVLNGKTALIGEAIRRAAAAGARTVGPYVAQIIKDWRFQEIDTREELADYDFRQDCMNGRSIGLDHDEAYRLITQHREEKYRLRTGGVGRG